MKDQIWRNSLEKARQGYNELYYGVVNAEGKQSKYDAQIKLKAVIEKDGWNLPLQTKIIDSLDIPIDKIYKRQFPLHGEITEGKIITLAKAVCRTLMGMYPQPIEAFCELQEETGKLQVILSIPEY